MFSGDTRKRLLEQRKLTLSAAVDICRALEASKSPLKEMEPSVSQATESLNKVAFKVKGSRPEKSSFTKSTCKFCGGDHPFVKPKCPAYGRNCEGRDHFAKVCKTKGPRTKRKTDNKVRNIEAESSIDSDSDSTRNWVKNVGTVPNSIKCKMLVKGKPLAFLIDTGASVNILPERYPTHRVGSRVKTLRSYCDTAIETKGTGRLVIVNPRNNKKYAVDFVVVPNSCQPVIGLKAAQRM